MIYTLRDALTFVKENSPNSPADKQQKMAAYILKTKIETGQTEDEIWKTLEFMRNDIKLDICEENLRYCLHNQQRAEAIYYWELLKSELVIDYFSYNL